MTLLCNWQQRYTDLTSFIAKHPEIVISARMISIPEHVRPEFWKLFNLTRSAFLEETLPELLSKAQALSQQYLAAETRAVELLKLDEVVLPPILQTFLRHPADGLIRDTWNPLMDLIRARLDFGAFERQCIQGVGTTFDYLYLKGYEKWALLNLVNLLQADKLFGVVLREGSFEEEIKYGITEEVPSPSESKRLSFDHAQEAIFAVPDFIIHAPRLHKFLAFRTEFKRSFKIASKASERVTWLNLGSQIEPGADTALIYVADNLEDLSLVADNYRVSRPQFMLVFKMQGRWYEAGGIKDTELTHAALKPTYGTYILSKEMPSEAALSELGKTSEIKLIPALGYDGSKLAELLAPLEAHNLP